jgi:hypothetical protein
MSFSVPDLARALKNGSPISAEDVLAARRWAWSDGTVAPAEAAAIFELNQIAHDRSPEWTDFFVEAMTHFVVNGREPKGYVADADADWLIARIASDGAVETMAELEVLVKVIETALNCPTTLKAFVLGTIERIVIEGKGPTRHGELTPGRIDEVEVALLRRVLFASGGDAAVTISRDEAELLWRLKDATLDADNAPGWKPLFVQGVANYLLAYSAYRPLARAEAARREAFMNDTRTSVVGFLGRMFKAAPGEPAGRDYRAEAAAAEELTPAEAGWLKAHLDVEGARDPLEAALVAFLRETCALPAWV